MRLQSKFQFSLGNAMLGAIPSTFHKCFRSKAFTNDISLRRL